MCIIFYHVYLIYDPVTNKISLIIVTVKGKTDTNGNLFEWQKRMDDKWLTNLLLTGLQYNSHDISSKNLLLDQLIIPQLIIILILISCLLDIVRRNSVLV